MEMDLELYIFNNLEIKNFIIEFKNNRTEISYKGRPDKGIITIEHTLTEKEFKNEVK